MAKAIEFVYKPQDHPGAINAEKERNLAAAHVEHYDALMDLWATLDAAHKNHVLDILRGAMCSADYVTGELSSAMKSEAAIRGMRNLIMLAEMLGSIEPEALHRIVATLPVALGEADKAATRKEPPSLWQLFRSFTSKEARRALGVGAAVVVAVGAGLAGRKKSS